MFLPILSSPQDSSCKVNKNDYLFNLLLAHIPLKNKTKQKNKEESKNENKKILAKIEIIIIQPGIKFSARSLHFVEVQVIDMSHIL